MTLQAFFKERPETRAPQLLGEAADQRSRRWRRDCL